MLYVENCEHKIRWKIIVITTMILVIIIHFIIYWLTVNDIVIVINIKISIKHCRSNCYNPAASYLIFMAESAMVW